MTAVHKSLAEGRWNTLTLCTQMANIGSEIERTIIWARKGNRKYKEMAFFRALELLDLTLRDPKNRGGRLKEIARVKEALVDHFLFRNEYNSTYQQWQRYFHSFNHAARLGR